MLKSIAAAAALSMTLAGTALAAPGTKHVMIWYHRGPNAGLTRLKAQLAITPSQQDAWNRFAKAWKNTRPKRRHATPSETAGLVPAPRIFARLTRRADERAQRVKQLAESADSLYKVLSPEQRAVLNTHLADMHGRRHLRVLRVRRQEGHGPKMPPPPLPR